VEISPDPGEGGAACQQPGSPGCPQQRCLLIILIQLLRKARRSFLWKGIGADQLVKNGIGIYFPLLLSNLL